TCDPVPVAVVYSLTRRAAGVSCSTNLMPGTASLQMSMASRTASVYDPARSRSIAMTSGSASAAWAGATLPATTAEAQRTAVSNFTIRRGTAGPPEPVPDHDARKLSEGDRHGPSGEK